MARKCVLVIGSAHGSRYTVWKYLKQYGCCVILVNDDENCHGTHQVDKFFKYDFSEHSEDKFHAENIIKLLQGEQIDGCFTLSESCVPLTAMICNRLDLPGGDVKAAQIVKSKYEYLRLLGANAITKSYCSDVFRISDIQDFERLSESFKFPAVLKPVYGSGATCVMRVDTKVHAVNEYSRLQEIYYRNNTGRATSGFNNEMILMEFIEGSKHEVDVVIANGALLVCIISDYAPSVTDRFIYTCYQLPSQLPADKQRDIVSFVDRICKTIGLKNVALNFELRMTTMGPKLIEVNGRMGGIHRMENIKKCFDVDILKHTVLVSLGMVLDSPALVPKCKIMACLLYPSFHGRQLQNIDVQSYLQELENHGNVKLFHHEVNPEQEFEQPLCCVCFYDDNLVKAKQRVIDLFERCSLNSSCYDIRILLKNL